MSSEDVSCSVHKRNAFYANVYYCSLRFIRKKSTTTTLSLQNMFRSIIDHRQLKVVDVDDEFEFHLKLQKKYVNLRYYIAVTV